jgi:hypothetical protein
MKTLQRKILSRVLLYIDSSQSIEEARYGGHVHLSVVT